MYDKVPTNAPTTALNCSTNLDSIIVIGDSSNNVNSTEWDVITTFLSFVVNRVFHQNMSYAGISYGGNITGYPGSTELFSKFDGNFTNNQEIQMYMREFTANMSQMGGNGNASYVTFYF